MKRIAIIHFLPIEYYPPITNLITYISSECKSNRLIGLSVFTSNNIKQRNDYSVPDINNNITILRYSFPTPSDNILIKSLKYISFNLFTLLNLIRLKPVSILYYETYSAWPVYLYSKYFNRNCKIFIHNHEYSDKSWYANTMNQVKYFHKLEKRWLYKKAVWISQTNEARMELFHEDHSYIKKDVLKIMPNYPPKRWNKYDKNNNKSSIDSPLKIVYIGSLSLKNTYIKEFCEWVEQQKGDILFDIYSFNLDETTLSYLENLESEFIRYYKNGIEYNDIPKTLTNYNVGVVLYKPFSLNYINNVTNKFYEYFICGLDIWFSKTMKSTHQHINPKTYPRVIPIDFTRLNYFDLQKAVDKKRLQKNKETYYCENAYTELINELIK